MATNDAPLGWTDPSNTRGTFDILKTSIGTVILLCWSSVCPDVPSLGSGIGVTEKSSGNCAQICEASLIFLANGARNILTRYGPRLNLFLLAVLGPDFVFMIAVGQAHAAWTAKQAFIEAGYSDWTMRHCFFVNMGGLHLQFRDREAAGQCSIPVNCNQLLHLVQHQYIDMPPLTREDIEDRNKTDALGRLIAIIQSLWFTMNSLARAVQGLFLTTLELTTLAFVFLMTACSICWWRKPMDISRPVFVKIDKDLSTILQRLDAPTVPRGTTPLSFIDRQEWFLNILWIYYTELLRKLKLIPLPQSKPTEADHFPSISFQEIALWWEIPAGILIMIYSAIFMAAWNFHFPTATEHLLWRVASAACLGYGIVGDCVAAAHHRGPVVREFWIKHTKWVIKLLNRRSHEMPPAQTMLPEPNIRKKAGKECKLQSLDGRIYHFFDRVRNVSPDKDPALAMALRWWIPTTFLCVVYCFSRAFILLEDLIALRSLPPSAYQTVNFGQFSPIL